jgi:hypothetical protein
VAYYEADAVEHLGEANFENLRALDTMHEQDLYLRAGEYVSVADYQEVMDWVIDSEDVDPRYHIPGLSHFVGEFAKPTRAIQEIAVGHCTEAK